MPEDVRPDQPQPERTNHGPSSKGSESPGGHRARPECCHDWRCGCEPDPYCRPAPPYWDPHCAPWPHHAWRRHHWAHFWPAPPDGGLFEAMMRFAAGAAGFRGRLWSEMADATRYAQRDWRYPWAPHPYGCDPCPPPWPSCDPCAPPRSHCDPCPPPHERCDDSEAPDAINLKELRATLEAGKEERLQKLQAALKAAELAKTSPDHLDKLRRELESEGSKADAAIDAVIHDVKLARVTEAMRRKAWSRGASPGRWR